MLPGLWEHFELNKNFFEYFKEYPEKFYDNIDIGCFYGNFQYCVWDGGRVFRDYKWASFEKVLSIKNYLKENKIPLRLIFTNSMLENKDLYNHYCNLICSLCEDEDNEIVINSSLLKEYLKEKYPKYSFISSTTKCNSFKASLDELNEYKYVCLDYNHNHRIKDLELLDQFQKNKIEFLVNAICPSGCPNRKEHYRLNSVSHLNLGKNYTINCKITDYNMAYNSRCYQNNITAEKLYNLYVPLGFLNFKLEGRSLKKEEVILNYCYYMVKPEYHDEVIFEMLMR